MKLLIHDLNEKEWNEAAEQYRDYEVISGRGSITPCTGCFGCWLKNPGQCVMQDGYENMGELIHRADEVTVISRYTYGGFSSCVKNVLDRSIGWVLPYFEVVEGEMHHRKRYPEEKPFTFIFRGSAFTAEEKEKAKAYTEAVCRNLRGRVKELAFVPCEPEPEQAAETPVSCNPEKIILLNGSLRGEEANTRKFLGKLSESLVKGEIVNLSAARTDETVRTLLSAGTLVLGMPMYVDGIPSQVLRVMERLEQNPGARKRIYVVAKMGLYDVVFSVIWLAEERIALADDKIAADTAPNLRQVSYHNTFALLFLNGFYNRLDEFTHSIFIFSLQRYCKSCEMQNKLGKIGYLIKKTCEKFW